MLKMNLHFLFIVLCLVYNQNLLANWQLGTSGSSSSSSQSQSLRVSQTFFDQHKLTLNTSNGKLTSDTVDQESSSLKLSYRWKYSSDLKLTAQLNQMDEYNLFTSQGYGFKLQKSILAGDLHSTISIGIDSSNKQYSNYSQLSLGQRQISIGYEIDITENLNLNMNYSSFQYQTESQIINRRLNGSSIIFSEIDSYVSGLVVSSMALGFDYITNDLTTSFGFSVDRTDPATPLRSIGQSLQFDYNINEDLNLGLALTRSKELGTTTTSDSMNWSLSYQFPN